MEPIAIIGIGCRFPGAQDPESFWELLHNGVDATAQVPSNRWDIDRFYNEEPVTPGKMNTRRGGFLKEVDRFDASFFGISPREAERMDPQQRLVLEVTWEALENAAIIPENLSGSQTGVFIAIGNYDYGRLLAKDVDRISAYDGTGNTLCIAANRLSYVLNLRGPSLVIETACSSSLVALHFACRSLQTGESNLGLVGGVSLMLSPEPTITYSQARMMANDGRCKTFDASADGYVRGEGCGVVVLKRLCDAVRDGDRIQAIIKGSAVNQDGTSNGLTAPNGPSQQAVIRQALENAGVSPDQISYVEAHGTGTALGDPIEFKSLKAVLMEGRKPEQICSLGSVKTNIGHLEAASGMASVIKVVLSLQHKEIPAHLHLQELNPYISLQRTTFSIPTESQPWNCSGSRLAGISGFGFGGTNCHLILEQAADQKKLLDRDQGENRADRESERPLHALALSAKDDGALRDLAQRYADLLVSGISLADLCFSANTGRSHFERRLAVVAESSIQLRDSLRAFARGEQTTGLTNGKVTTKKRQKIAFLFTGQGSQYLDMGRSLYETQPIFRETLDHCDRLLRSYLDRSLLELLYANSDRKILDQTAYTQPALFAIEYALFKLWQSWGVEPAVVMGHSVGEYVAACVAGVFSLEDGLKLIAERGRLMQALPTNGSMVAVLASESKVNSLIQAYEGEGVCATIAAINGPQSVVISGHSDSIEVISTSLEVEGIKTKKLQVSHAFHSSLMEPMLGEFERVANQIKYSAPQISLVSNLTGNIATSEIATPEYWCRHIKEPVRFATSMELIYRKGYRVFLEIGSKPILLGMARRFIPEEGCVWLPSLHQAQSNWQTMLSSLTKLYVRGASINWFGLDRDYSRRRVALPTYPFQRQRYWFEDDQNQDRAKDSSSQVKIQTHIVDILERENVDLLTQQIVDTGELSSEEVKLLPKLLEVLIKQGQQQKIATEIDDWFHEVEWQTKTRQLPKLDNGIAPNIEPSNWLIFTGISDAGQTLGKLLQEQLQQQGHDCTLIYPGDVYQAPEDGFASLNPSEPGHFDLLLQEFENQQPTQVHPHKVIYLWGLEAKTTSELTISVLEETQKRLCGSLLHLVQSLSKNNTSLTSQLWLVTRGAVPACDSELAVAQAPLWGLGKVIALEYPQLWGGMLDLAPKSESNEVQNLLAEISHPQGEDHLAFRNGERYVARLVKKTPPKFSQAGFNPDGTYLITGGLGALGLTITKWMVEQGAKHLVLTGRSQVSPQTQKTISQLEKIGATIKVARADVTDQADMLRVLEGIKTSNLPLQGIIHAAGVTKYETLEDINLTSLEFVLRPKVIGTWILHQLTQSMKLDFFVCFSSIASVWGSKGQAHYAAANHFLDVFAHHRHRLGLPALSVNWGPWAGAGMAKEEFQALLKLMGVKGLEPDSAIAALASLLKGDSPQVTVADINWNLFKEIYEARGPRSLLAQIGESANSQELEQFSRTSQPGLSEPKVSQPKILQQFELTAPSDRHAFLISYLQDQVKKVLKLTSSQLPPPEQGLFEMGMDSLMAIELVNLVQTQLQVKLSMLEVLQAQNITKIANLLLKQLTPDIAISEVGENSLNLYDEAILEESIYPGLTVGLTNSTEKTKTDSILLTGATGFLGAFLLQELLEQTTAEIFCLVRANNASMARQKIKNNLKFYELWESRYDLRIIPIVGDLSKPHLGLTPQEFAKLAKQIDIIYHNGAVLNFVYPYSALKKTNVLGTQEVLKLACQWKVKPLHYVSTDAVFDSSAYYGKKVKESEPIIYTDGIDLGYTQTKWVAEKLVTIARDRGLPVTIYRPPLIAGDSQTGIWNTDDFTCRFLKGCIQMGSIPEMDCGITIVPVDYVSRAIVYLSQLPESSGKAFHLNNPHFSSWNNVANWINKFGYQVRQIPYQEWEAQLIKTSAAKENALSGLIPFFMRRWSEEELTFSGLAQRRVKLDCSGTVSMLEGSSVICSPVNSQLLNTYFSYFVRSGFLETPKVPV
ncbi:type I polyketide synthase [Mastigocoleus testarum]|uniref:Uncharacterized protein n=1 Tax=Mastigocoleus testarum BC008 TaxID=371196 RepID=A0A0V7ZD49_9CYAN|nr:type I polyketide synthase [Mastigocoleus testarum]KST62480.1 hypothetical protein BC008_09940 [Mastigocoleus testarum BC008]